MSSYRAAVTKKEAWRINVRGVVQGVGFRPFVYKIATDIGLKGWVCNTSGDVTIELEGETARLEDFLHKLKTVPPPQSHIEDISVSRKPLTGYDRFEIRNSQAREGEYQLVSPDLATCKACQEDIFDPANRRYGYPFTNCTNCGPRFTIIEDIPYDRPRTTMRSFIMCPDCQKEYDDPLDRRFHAQPNACLVCGPKLELVDRKGKAILGDALAQSSSFLKEGKIVAIKGLGGFLLACDATNDNAVMRMRARKKRLAKPFAVMLRSIDEVREHCQVSVAEEKLLCSPQSPIVLLKWKQASTISRQVAPGLHYMGVMLPYTPLHHLLMDKTGLPLVMTSGNLTEEPIAKDNDEALRRLEDIADYFLLHNRDIYSRYDDSVTMVLHEDPQIIRRARGYAPYPVMLTFESKQLIACGAELKNTFCLTKDNHAFIGQHIGDLENLETLEHFETTVVLYERLFRIAPEAIVCDTHPDYLSTRWARSASRQKGLPLYAVQHHYAHIASCMADNQIDKPVIGVAFDGTGYGTDGRIWGGEFLLADFKSFQRKFHLEYLPLPGGTAAILKPYRTAVGYLYTLLGEEALSKDLPFLKDIDEFELELIKKQVDKSINTPLTSSCGRLFDAVSSMLGIRTQIEYEGQAAIELEMVSGDNGDNTDYPFILEANNSSGVIRLREMFSAIMADMARGASNSIISTMFHNTVARMIVEVCSHISRETGIKSVVLSGGVFQNRLLLSKAIAGLKNAGLNPLTHRQVPCNDGGVSLGQAVIANFMEEGKCA